MDDEQVELIQSFVEEANEHLEGIESDLLTLESSQGQVEYEVVNRIFRAMHTIKGSSSFLDFVRIPELAHASEEVLSLIRSKNLKVNPEISSALLRSVDLLTIMLRDTSASESVDCSAEIAALKRIKELNSETPKDVEEAAPQPEAQEEPCTAPSDSPSPPDTSKAATKASESTLRVSIELLDRLMTTVGELVLNRNQLLQAHETG
ncbi:MAG: Hpt domain-containing protein, partial [Chlamydiia bacterium]|nr:Hpt domain-containing protein [Chlamydiia bacterium]